MAWLVVYFCVVLANLLIVSEGCLTINNNWKQCSSEDTLHLSSSSSSSSQSSLAVVLPNSVPRSGLWSVGWALSMILLHTTGLVYPTLFPSYLTHPPRRLIFQSTFFNIPLPIWLNNKTISVFFQCMFSNIHLIIDYRIDKDGCVLTIVATNFLLH